MSAGDRWTPTASPERLVRPRGRWQDWAVLTWVAAQDFVCVVALAAAAASPRRTRRHGRCDQPGTAPRTDSDRWPVRLRPVQGAPGGAGRARRVRGVGAGYLAPAGAGEVAGPAGPGGDEHALLPARWLPGDHGQRRDDGVLGCGGSRPGAEPLAAPDVRRVLRQVRRRHRQGSVPGRSAGDLRRPGGCAGGGRRRRCRRLRLGPQRNLDRRRRPGAPTDRRDSRSVGSRRRHVRRRRAAGRHQRDGCLLLRAAEGLRVRRRPVDRTGVPRRS